MMVRITKDQEDILHLFTCTRLSSNEENRESIKKFKSGRGNTLVNYLMQNGWEEDYNGENAFYLIQDQSGFPYLYFSLKCGAMFEPLDESAINDEIVLMQEIIQKLRSSDNKISTMTDIFVMTKALSDATGMSFEEARTDLIIYFFRHKESLRTKRQSIEEDRKREEGRPIMRVNKTMPGIELVQFCSNDEAKPMWERLKNKYDIRFPFGQVFFWYFVVPIIEEVRRSVGCQHLFLFAADSSPDETLINYYEVSLKFSKPDDIGTNKPTYDFECIFMSQTVNDLIKNRENFLNEFNVDKEDDDVI